MSDTYSRFRDEVMAGGAGDGPGAEDPTTGAMQGLAGLVGILVLLGLLAWYSGWAFLFVVGLLVCVFLHELGHFVTARLTGMKATQFFLFMGPRLWSFRRGETEYGIRAYPLGAFVRIIGMSNVDEVDPADEPRAYRSKSYPRRMLVITSGSLMHILVAVVLLFSVFATKGDQVLTDRVAVGAVVEGSAAERAGLAVDDVIVAVDGTPITTSRQLVDTIQSHAPGDAISLRVERAGELRDLTVELGANPDGRAFLGTSSGQRWEWQGMAITTAARESVTRLGSVAWESAKGVIKVLNPINSIEHLVGSNDDLETRPTTVVGVSRLSDTFGAETGVAGVLLLLAGANVFFGLFNMFPVLPLDGGHAAIATYERVRSRRGRPPYRADVRKMMPVAMGMVTLLGLLLVTGLYLDIAKPIR